MGISFLIGIGAYLVSLIVALSPIGEWILRKQTGCKKIRRREQLEYLMPIFQEAYDRARQLEPGIADDIQLYINDNEAPNAFATGRKTICITKGLLQLPPEQIKAILGHEFGHLAHKDTDLILVVAVGNIIVNLLIFGIKLFIEVCHLIIMCLTLFFGGKHGWLGTIMAALYRLCLMAIVGGLSWLWTKIGIVLVMKSSRQNEYEADEFSFNMGYGNELCMGLENICGTGAKGLFASLASSHPDKDDRIARLQELGATYRVEW